MRWFLLLLVSLVLGCTFEAKSDDDVDGDTDGDADSDADADADADSDSDGDSDGDTDGDSDADTDSDSDADTDSDSDGDGDADGDSDADGDIDPDAPEIILFRANTDEVHDGDTLVLSAIVTDPNGIEDLIGGTLDDPGGGTYGAFATTGEEGAYTLSLDWEAINLVRPIDTPVGGSDRAFRATFFDSDGHLSSAELVVTLSCSDSNQGTCGGACDSLWHENRCGDCETVCPDLTTCDYATRLCDPDPEPGILRLESDDNYEYDVDAWETGRVLNGTDDAFDGCLGLSVNGTGFHADGPYDSWYDGQGYRTEVMLSDHLEVRRYGFVPRDGASFFRGVDVVVNRDAIFRPIEVRYSCDLGSDSGTVCVDSASGDTNCTSADEWIASDDASTDPGLGFVFFSSDADVSFAMVEPWTSGVPAWRYDSIELAPGDSIAILYFAVQAPTGADAAETASDLANLEGGALEEIGDEAQSVVNFVLP